MRWYTWAHIQTSRNKWMAFYITSAGPWLMPGPPCLRLIEHKPFYLWQYQNKSLCKETLNFWPKRRWRRKREGECRKDRRAKERSVGMNVKVGTGRKPHVWKDPIRGREGRGGRDSYSHPLHVVFRFLLNEVDAFQYIGDIINPSLLHFQHLCCLVQIQDPIRRLAQ